VKFLDGGECSVPALIESQGVRGIELEPEKVTRNLAG